MTDPHQPPPERDPNAEGGSLLYGDTDDLVIPGHKYDGIREYDNPMPGWWVWLFVACVVYAPVYVLGVHTFDFIDDYGDDLAESQADLAEIRAAYAAANPGAVMDEAELQRYVEDPSMALAGAANYEAFCAACHAPEGGGLIGPNLADAYWIHGGSPLAIYEVLTHGVPDQGMPAWDAALTPEERAEVTAFVKSLQGTDPPNPKEPQGEPYYGG
ncbi:MAG: cbb3-type cytochrome c oxidase N-terminal domain-containing protein [Rhodothermales bacterium]|nr:cbb3-type cytochrome c oxidase N-terminal domain-containing protein [Rhodothermales bacterium]